MEMSLMSFMWQLAKSGCSYNTCYMCWWPPAVVSLVPRQEAITHWSC